MTDRYYVDAQSHHELPEHNVPSQEHDGGLMRGCDICAWCIVDRSRNLVKAVCPDIVTAHEIADLLNAQT